MLVELKLAAFNVFFICSICSVVESLNENPILRSLFCMNQWSHLIMDQYDNSLTDIHVMQTGFPRRPGAIPRMWTSALGRGGLAGESGLAEMSACASMRAIIPPRHRHVTRVGRLLSSALERLQRHDPHNDTAISLSP